MQILKTMFWRKKPIATEEYSDLLTKYVKLEADMAALKHIVERMETRFLSLRASVNKKGISEEEDSKDNSEARLLKQWEKLVQEEQGLNTR